MIRYCTKSPHTALIGRHERVDMVIPEASLVRVWWGQVQVRSPAGCDNVNIFWSHHPTQIFWNPASNQSKMIMYVNDASNLLDSKKRLQKLKYGWNTIVARSLQLRCDNCSVHSYGGHTLNFGDVDDVHDWKHVTWIWQETCRRRSLGISIMPLLRLIKLIELLTVQSGSCIRHTTEESSGASVISTDDSAGQIKCCCAFGGRQIKFDMIKLVFCLK